jgi:hypothetical protein
MKMTSRQAKKIVKRQRIRCRSIWNGPEDIITHGEADYPEHTYRRALTVLRRSLDCESRQRTPGTIERCAKLYSEINLVRAGL